MSDGPHARIVLLLCSLGFLDWRLAFGINLPG
jgi:hypothetical protein